MAVEGHSLTPGAVPEEQFALLLAGTSIRGVAVIEALREHLLTGLTPKLACEKHAVNPSQFSLRLKAIQAESERVAQLSKFYGKA